jgi:hypothetical protein
LVRVPLRYIKQDFKELKDLREFKTTRKSVEISQPVSKRFGKLANWISLFGRNVSKEKGARSREEVD